MWCRWSCCGRERQRRHRPSRFAFARPARESTCRARGFGSGPPGWRICSATERPEELLEEPHVSRVVGVDDVRLVAAEAQRGDPLVLLPRLLAAPALDLDEEDG